MSLKSFSWVRFPIEKDRFISELEKYLELDYDEVFIKKLVDFIDKYFERAEEIKEFGESN
ncbi:MAG TPA: hypothetical protein VMX17_03415 [Candidatus Glassbacteria bacterium]|nr:hypothetical protein [Candidatus Glassbacteria bacterium]